MERVRIGSPMYHVTTVTGIWWNRFHGNRFENKGILSLWQTPIMIIKKYFATMLEDLFYEYDNCLVTMYTVIFFFIYYD